MVSLNVTDIDSHRQVIRVEQGRGRKDRYAMLSLDLLELLRSWWRAGREKGVMLPGGWLFPGQNPVNPLTTRQLNRMFHAAKAAAEIDKPVNPHSLRRCFATHFLKQKVDIRVIQVLLGHQKLDTTARSSTAEQKTDHVAAFHASDWEGAVRRAVCLGGDTDTLACIAGAVAEAAHGMPAAIAAAVRDHLTDDLRIVLDRFDAARRPRA